VSGVESKTQFVTYLHTANSFQFLYYLIRISQNSFPNFIYIFPKSFMIFQKEILEAAFPLLAFGGIYSNSKWN
jgi:hypothetical protein